VAKATLAKGSRISGAQRTTLASQYAKRYSGGESIRKIAEDAGRSYGFVHNVLKESGVDLRGRGGATRGAKKTAPPGTAAAKKISKIAAPKAMPTLQPPEERPTKGTKKVATTAKATAKATAKKAPAKTAADVVAAAQSLVEEAGRPSTEQAAAKRSRKTPAER
jgi:hypothetical protein